MHPCHGAGVLRGVELRGCKDPAYGVDLDAKCVPTFRCGTEQRRSSASKWINHRVAVFGVRPTSWPLLILAVFATGICFVGIMMLLAVLSPSERAGSGLGWGVLLLFSMIGGGMIPLFFMPPWMRSISVVSPIRWAVLALEGGIWRGLTLTEMLLPLAILTGIGIVGFAAGTRGMRLARQS